MPNINEYAKTTGFGSGENRTTFDSKGQRMSRGEAAGYEDLVTSLKGKKLSSSTGKVDWNYGRHAAKFQSGGSITNLNDKVGDEHQYPHSAREDGNLYYHIHWIQKDTFANLADLVFTFRYRVHANGAEEETSWTTVLVTPDASNSLFPYNDEISLVQITKLATVSMAGKGISAMVDWELARTDSSSVPDIYVKYCDPHYLNDTNGSDTEYVKDEGA